MQNNISGVVIIHYATVIFCYRKVIVPTASYENPYGFVMSYEILRIVMIILTDKLWRKELNRCILNRLNQGSRLGEVATR